MANSQSNTSSNNTNIRCPNIGGPLRNPRFVVLHYTASTNFRSTVQWLCDRRARASAHIVIARDGEIQALVPFTRVAWHAGASTYKSYNGLNNYSIGIELVNAGPVKQTEDGFRTVVGQQLIPAEEVIEAKHECKSFGYTHWQKYTHEQVEALDKLLDQLFNDFPTLVEIVGHDMISIGRKSDPGPAFAEHMRELKAKHDRWVDR